MTKQLAATLDVAIEPRRDWPGAWTVEAIDDEGGIEQAIFAGPLAQERAHDYLAYRYNTFAALTDTGAI